MPNNGRITLCPYYRDEKNLSISCEDVFRRFRWPAQKKRWLDNYCDKDWRSCPHAKSLGEMYKKFGENMSKNKYLEIEHKNKELDKELRKVSAQLGKSLKREEEKDKKIKELRHKIEAKDAAYIRRSRYAGELEKELEMVGAACEKLFGHLAYMMIKFGDGKMVEADFKEWGKGKEFGIDVSKRDDETGAVLEWQVTVQNEREENEHKPE